MVTLFRISERGQNQITFLPHILSGDGGDPNITFRPLFVHSFIYLRKAKPDGPETCGHKLYLVVT